MRPSRSALLLFLCLVAALATACGSSSSPSAGPPTTTVTVASGGVTCTTITGSLTFSPPLTTKGGSSESTTVALHAAGCTTKGSNVASVTGGTGSATITSSTNACAGLLTSRPLTVDLTWAPSTIHSSVVTFSSYTGASGPSGGEGFILPAPGGTAKVTGSFSGSDHGASSTAATYSSQTGTQLLSACGAATGLTSIDVTSGILTLK